MLLNEIPAKLFLRYKLYLYQKVLQTISNVIKIVRRFLPTAHHIGADIAQLVRARPSELEVRGSILGDSKVYFDFLLIHVALALNTRKTEHWQRKGGKVRTEGHKFIGYLITVPCYPR